MDLDQLRNELAAGRISPEKILDLLVKSQQQIQTSQQQLAAALAKITELERRLGGPPTQRPELPYSVQAELRRRHKQKKRKRARKPNAQRRRGRITTAEKIALASRSEAVYPEGIPQNQCWYSHTRVVWRLEEGRAVMVAYEVYRGRGNRYGQVPEVIGRSEFGIEIMLAIGWQVYVLGLSFDKVCLVMNFFQSLRLRKSQVDALLTQLSRHWQEQFEILCTLVAHSAVVHADETSWSIRSEWAFLGEQARVILFGVHKDAATLKKILDPATFKGLVISDDAAVYAEFTNSQKCWAHLLRKAIRLTLLEPENQEFRRFADQLLETYHEARGIQRDGRLSQAGKERKVAELDDRVTDLCMPVWQLECKKLTGPADDYRLLVNELMKLMIAQELFRFVTADDVVWPNGETAPVSGTNNEAERTLRNPAMARKTGRTNKTAKGARRQTIVVSVLESLRCYLAHDTLASVVNEVSIWLENRKSCFNRLLMKLKIKVATVRNADEPTMLERLIPDTS